jgi:hypothetical protein
MAMFIVLKLGIGFKDRVGSSVVGETTVADSPLHDGTSPLESLPPHRFCMLGVFDAGVDLRILKMEHGL